MAFIAFLFRKEKNSSKLEYVLWFSTEHNFQKFGPVNGLGLIMLSNRRGYFEILSVLFFFCDFRGARFFEPELVEGTSLSTLFERASWINWNTSFKKKCFLSIVWLILKPWNIFVLEGCDSSNCAYELGFFHFSVSFTRQGTRVFFKRALEFYFV